MSVLQLRPRSPSRVTLTSRPSADRDGIYEELPAESWRTFSFTAPMQPGDYDVYCDTCCGGQDSPSMHGVIRVVA